MKEYDILKHTSEALIMHLNQPKQWNFQDSVNYVKNKMNEEIIERIYEELQKRWNDEENSLLD